MVTPARGLFAPILVFYAFCFQCMGPYGRTDGRTDGQGRRVVRPIRTGAYPMISCRTVCVVSAAARPVTSCASVRQVSTPNALRLLIDDDSQQTCRQNGTVAVAPRDDKPVAYDPRPGKGPFTTSQFYFTRAVSIKRHTFSVA